MVKVFNNDFLKILNLEEFDSFHFFNEKYIINFSVLELVEHLTNGLGFADNINDEIFNLLMNKKDIVLNKLKKEVNNPSSYFYMDKGIIKDLEYSLSGTSKMMHFIYSTKNDAIKMFLSLFFVNVEDVFEIYHYTNNKLEKEAFIFTKKEYDDIFVFEFLDNLNNISLKI